jgi:hypothetical protein
MHLCCRSNEFQVHEGEWPPDAEPLQSSALDKARKVMRGTRALVFGGCAA